MKKFGSINLSKGGGGSVGLEVEEDEDLWALYNIVAAGDKVRARTSRKVKLESSSGNVNVQVKKMVLQIEVTKVEFEPSDKSIRFAGKNLTENDDVKLGQFHTIEIGLHDNLNLDKSDWDFAARRTLHEATDARAKAEVGALLIESGQAALYILTNALVKDCGRVNSAIAKKGRAYGKADKSQAKFFEMILSAMRHNFPFATMRCIVVGGPNEIRSAFYDWLFETAIAKGYTDVSSKKKIFVQSLASGVSKATLMELLQDPKVAERMSETKALGEVATISKFYAMQKEEPLRAAYGPGPVLCALEMGAIQTLLISDELFRSSILKHRLVYSETSQQVTEGGGNVIIVAAMGVCGEQIKNLAGIAAILRFPVHDLEELDPSKLPECLL